MGVKVIEERYSFKDYIDKRRPTLKRRYIAKAECSCGNIFYPFLENVTGGKTKACRGCSNRKHSCSKTKLYKIWTAMKQRCYNPGDKKYARYGGRGIQVAKQWVESFEKYKKYVDQLDKPRNKKRLSLDRIDNNGNYEPGNLRWATDTEQNLNTERSIKRRNNVWS